MAVLLFLFCQRRMFWIPFSTTICQSNWTLDRTFIAYVAFLTLSSSTVPPAIPCSSALVIPANPEQGNHFLSDSGRTQGHAASLVASRSRSTRWSLPPLSRSATMCRSLQSTRCCFQQSLRQWAERFAGGPQNSTSLGRPRSPVVTAPGLPVLTEHFF